MKRAMLTASFLILTSATQAQSPVPVTVDNFGRAESDLYFGNGVKDAGGIGKLFHHREPMAIDKQGVIRSNRDTLYSMAVVDLDAGPVTIKLPDAGKRFRSLMVVNEDHYIVGDIEYRAGSYTYDRKKVGTRYALIGLRTLVDPNDPKDVEKVRAVQDAVTVSQKAPASSRYRIGIRSARRRCGTRSWCWRQPQAGFKDAFGAKGQVDPVRHLIGTAAGWGGNPDKDATYLSVTPERTTATPSTS